MCLRVLTLAVRDISAVFRDIPLNDKSSKAVNWLHQSFGPVHRLSSTFLSYCYARTLIYTYRKNWDSTWDDWVRSASATFVLCRPHGWKTACLSHLILIKLTRSALEKWKMKCFCWTGRCSPKLGTVNCVKMLDRNPGPLLVFKTRTLCYLCYHFAKSRLGLLSALGIKLSSIWETYSLKN